MGHIQIGYRYVYQCTLHIYRVYTQDTHTFLHMGETDAIYFIPEPAGTSSKHTPPCLQARYPLKMTTTSLSTRCILWKTTRTPRFLGMAMVIARAGTREVQVVAHEAHPIADLLILDSSDPPLSPMT